MKRNYTIVFGSGKGQLHELRELYHVMHVSTLFRRWPRLHAFVPMHAMGWLTFSKHQQKAKTMQKADQSMQRLYLCDNMDKLNFMAILFELLWSEIILLFLVVGRANYMNYDIARVPASKDPRPWLCTLVVIDRLIILAGLSRQVFWAKRHDRWISWWGETNRFHFSWISGMSCYTGTSDWVIRWLHNCPERLLFVVS